VPRACLLALLLLGNCAAQVRLIPLLADLSGDVYDAAISPDGKTVAFTWCRSDPRYHCDVYLRPIEGGESRVLFKDKNADFPQDFQWSPDGKWIADNTNISHSAATLEVRSLDGKTSQKLGSTCGGSFAWTADSGGVIGPFAASPEPFYDDCGLGYFPIGGMASVRIAKRGTSPVISPDGRTLAFVRGGEILIQDLVDFRTPHGAARVVVHDEALRSGPHWIANGAELLYTTQEWTPLHRIAITPGAKPRVIPGIDEHTEIRQLKSAANGAIIAEIDRHDDALWRIDLRSAAPSFEKLQSPPHSVYVHRVSPDGQRVLFVASGGIWTSDLDGANKRLVTYHREVIVNPRWSPDGLTIAFRGDPAEGNADMRSRVYVVPVAGGKPRRLLPKRDDVEFLDWSRGGKFLYVSREPNEMALPSQTQLWRVELASERLTQITSKDGGNHAEESVDGKMLYFTNSVYSKLRSVPANGGAENTVLSQTELSSVFGGAFSVGADAIYFVPNTRGKSQASILKLNLKTGTTSEFATVPFDPLTIQLSRDERYLFATSRPNPVTSRVLIEGIK
jgi:Tol biopolymer transport system component